MSETSEQATRRRWVTLAEVVAVAGVVIAGLTFYTGWADRKADQAARVAEHSTEARERSRVDLVATVESDGQRLAIKDEKHDLQDLAVVFPKALGIAPERPVADIAIGIDAIETPILKLTDGGADDRAGRLPVLLTVRYWDGDTARTSTAIYDLIWKTEGRMLRGRTLRLQGMRLRERGGNQARLDTLWAREKL
ncbi:hypothetical protein [Sphingomonas sp. Leaf343]|uniref:hypothetical protein n=1 Tax=Sphingomonas sp. Leaf343 TaxID=1736345 RepID=UPI0006FDDCCE|nr:hypothetical protein [Sphingomonas sp. Leaf343]KQR83919.1 hypothetical protein ASG07_04650 [Sphingomonas sp. Leaf343]